jgi:hypothetical protein
MGFFRYRVKIYSYQSHLVNCMTSVSVEDVKVDREKAVKRTLDLVNVKSPTGEEVEILIAVGGLVGKRARSSAWTERRPSNFGGEPEVPGSSPGGPDPLLLHQNPRG